MVVRQLFKSGRKDAPLSKTPVKKSAKNPNADNPVDNQPSGTLPARGANSTNRLKEREALSEDLEKHPPRRP